MVFKPKETSKFTKAHGKMDLDTDKVTKYSKAATLTKDSSLKAKFTAREFTNGEMAKSTMERGTKDREKAKALGRILKPKKAT